MSRTKRDILKLKNLKLKQKNSIDGINDLEVR